MKINANQVTALRIVLLPFPFFLIYGSTTSRIWALIIFTLLGLTDYLDGLMARKYGVTSLGKLLDPIADKIFVAVTLIPLADLGILPMWIVWPIFLREFLVTEMRRFMTPGQKGLKVTELAKIKTTIQMIGVGLILLTETFPDKLITISFLSGLLLATVFLAIAIYSKGQSISQRLKTALLLESLGLIIAIVLPAKIVILTYGVIILLITLVSGAQYFTACFPEVLKKGIKGALHLTSSLAIPLLVLALLPFAPKDAHLLVVLILAIEFAIQGIDMWAVQEKRTDMSNIRKKFILPFLFGSTAILFSAGINTDGLIWYFLVVCTFSSIGYLCIDVWKQKELFQRGEFF